MGESHYLAFVPAGTLFGGALLVLARGRALGRRLQESIALLIVVVAFLVLDRLATLPRPFTASLGEWVPLPSAKLSLDLSLYVDGTALFFCTVLLLAAMAILVASALATNPFLDSARTMGLFLSALGSLTLVFFSSNLIALYFAWQLLILFTLFFFIKDTSLRTASAHPFFLAAHLSGLALLMSAILLGQDVGGYDFVSSRTHLTPPAVILFAVVAAAGISGQYPLHSWLTPLALGRSGLLALLLLPLAGIYLTTRLADMAVSWDPLNGAILMAAGTLSSLALAYLAFAETDSRRALAYVCASQIGYALVGLGLGTPLGRGGALTQLASLPPAFLLILLCLAPQEDGARTRRLSPRIELPGLSMRNGLLVLAGASLLGLPSPSGGFLARWMIYRAALDGGHLVAGAAMLLAGLLTVTPLLRTFRGDSTALPRVRSAALALPALLLLASFFLPWIPLPGLRLMPTDLSPLSPAAEGLATPPTAWLGLGFTLLVVAGLWLPRLSRFATSRPRRSLGSFLDLARPLGWLARLGLILAELAERGMAAAEGHPFMVAILTSCLLIILLVAG